LSCLFKLLFVCISLNISIHLSVSLPISICPYIHLSLYVNLR
jgi:hypothetical protein